VILYAKQAYGVKYADGHAAASKKDLDACGPYPEAFKALAQVAITLSEFLEEESWLPEVRDGLDSYAMACNELAEIAEKEREGKAPNQRLSDPEWQEILNRKNPAMPGWVGEIIGGASR